MPLETFPLLAQYRWSWVQLTALARRLVRATTQAGAMSRHLRGLQGRLPMMTGCATMRMTTRARLFLWSGRNKAPVEVWHLLRDNPKGILSYEEDTSPLRKVKIRN